MVFPQGRNIARDRRWTFSNHAPVWTAIGTLRNKDAGYIAREHVGLMLKAYSGFEKINQELDGSSSFQVIAEISPNLVCLFPACI